SESLLRSRRWRSWSEESGSCEIWFHTKAQRKTRRHKEEDCLVPLCLPLCLCVKLALSHLVDLDRAFPTAHLYLAHRLHFPLIVANRLPHHLRNQQLRIKLLIQFLDPRREVHYIADHRVLASQRRTNTPRHRFAGVQPDPHCRRQDRSRLDLLLQTREYLLRSVDRVQTILPIRQRRAKHRHKPVAQKLVDDPMMPVHDLDHELEQRLEIFDHFLRTSLLRETREVSDVEKHHAHVLAFAAQVRLQVEQLAHHLRRHVLAEGSRDAIAFLDHRVRVENAFSDLTRYKSGYDARHKEQEAAEKMLRY